MWILLVYLTFFWVDTWLIKASFLLKPPRPRLAAERVGEVCRFSCCVLGSLNSSSLWDIVGVGWAGLTWSSLQTPSTGHRWVWSAHWTTPNSGGRLSLQNFLEMGKKHGKETHLLSCRKKIAFYWVPTLNKALYQVAL